MSVQQHMAFMACCLAELWHQTQICSSLHVNPSHWPHIRQRSSNIFSKTRWSSGFGSTNQASSVWPISCLKPQISWLKEWKLVCFCLVRAKSCSHTGLCKEQEDLIWPLFDKEATYWSPQVKLFFSTVCLHLMSTGHSCIILQSEKTHSSKTQILIELRCRSQFLSQPEVGWWLLENWLASLSSHHNISNRPGQWPLPFV